MQIEKKALHTKIDEETDERRKELGMLRGHMQKEREEMRSQLESDTAMVMKQLEKDSNDIMNVIKKEKNDRERDTGTLVNYDSIFPRAPIRTQIFIGRFSFVERSY